MNRNVIVLAAACLLLACTRHVLLDDMKMNAELRKQIRKDMSEIHVSGECTTVLSDALRADLEKTGVRLQSVNGRFFTAVGNASAIQSLSRLKSIQKLEAAPEYHLKSGGESL